MLCILLFSLLALVIGRDNSSLPPSCNGKVNVQPTWTDKPTFVASHQYGLKYLAAPANITAPTTVLHVYGTPYQVRAEYC